MDEAGAVVLARHARHFLIKAGQETLRIDAGRPLHLLTGRVYPAGKNRQIKDCMTHIGYRFDY